MYVAYALIWSVKQVQEATSGRMLEEADEATEATSPTAPSPAPAPEAVPEPVPEASAPVDGVGSDHVMYASALYHPFTLWGVDWPFWSLVLVVAILHVVWLLVWTHHRRHSDNAAWDRIKARQREVKRGRWFRSLF